MAKNTSNSLRQSVIYQVYNRNHNKSGTFKEFITDLDRIKELGVDIVYLLPIHPIGQKNKKGELGCPYSIKDYRAVNPEYGTLEDFKLLIDEVHKRDMKLMIDVVYNHTSHDAVLLDKHPEWYFRKEDGNVGNRVGEWWDIIDLDYSDKDLWYELIDTLKYWASLGVDGYRCDVASMVSVDFWNQARKEVLEINPDFIWLAETVHKEFLGYIRSFGYKAYSDSEIFEAFDITYDYDIHKYFIGYLKGENTLGEYVRELNNQEFIYPTNYNKLRNLENHDQPRIASLVNDETINIWTSLVFFQKGSTMLYAGQEAKDTKTPSLFDKDLVDWSNMNDEFNVLIKDLIQFKHENDILSNHLIHKYHESNIEDVLYSTYTDNEKTLVGIFNLKLNKGNLKTEIKDGVYKDLINGKDITVKNGEIELSNDARIFYVDKN